MRSALVHLRLSFSIVLFPLFVWGLFLALERSPTIDWLQILAAFALIHILLYGGMNALNSYYDQDDGPIGALEQPPPADRRVLTAALVCKGLAVAGGLYIGLVFGLLVMAAVVLSVLYSHPWWRWKERPNMAVFTIFVGQGVLGVLWGWSATGARLDQIGSLSALGILGAALFTTGFYPLTGVYQIAADARRGMHTLAVSLGVEGCFSFAAALVTVGGTGIAAVLIGRGNYLVLVLGGIYVGVASLRTLAWKRRIRTSSPRQNQRELMRISYSNGIAIGLLLTALIVATPI